MPRVLEKVALGVQEKFNRKSKMVRVMVSFFTKIAKAKARHVRMAKGLAKGRVNVFRRFLSRCLAAALSPLDAIGHMLIWSKVKAALGEDN